MPPNTKCVDRSTSWGNPFIVGQQKWLADPDGNPVSVYVSDADAAVRWFTWYVQQSEDRMDQVRTLRGFNLACFCPLDAPCHADVLLSLANSSLGHQPAEEEEGA